MKQPKIAIVCDWIYGGGSERVIEALHQLYPQSPIYTSYCSDEWREKLGGKVVTGYLQHQPFAALRKFLPLLRYLWYKRLKLDGFDIVISCTGNGEAKAIKTAKNGKHICYCFTPVHFYWRHYDTYIKNPGFGAFDWLARIGLKLLVGPMRRLDYKAAQKPDQFIAISKHIQTDIKQFYGRDSVVIHPPVNVDRFSSINVKQRNGFVTVGRQTPYKHTDLIIEACNQLRLPLTVVGRGPEHDKLVQMAGPTIKFDTEATDDDVVRYMASAEAFIFAAEEDFGIAPVEGMAAGTPVIAYKAGGALDYIVEGKTGLFFARQTLQSLVRALGDFKPTEYSSGDIKMHANSFSQNIFCNSMQETIQKNVRSLLD